MLIIFINKYPSVSTTAIEDPPLLCTHIMVLLTTRVCVCVRAQLYAPSVGQQPIVVSIPVSPASEAVETTTAFHVSAGCAGRPPDIHY